MTDATRSIRVLPADVVFNVDDQETVYAAAVRQHYHWPSVCKGDGECGVCWMLVASESSGLTPKGDVERERLAAGLKANDPSARLACQTRVMAGTTTVFRRGVRKRDD